MMQWSVRLCVRVRVHLRALPVLPGVLHLPQTGLASLFAIQHVPSVDGFIHRVLLKGIT